MKQYLIILLCLVTTAIVVVSCANIASPDGGRYDEEPPVLVGAKPELGAINVNKKKMSIKFNEFIKLENASENVIISPPQIESANVRADGKSIKINLYDSLQANTTYTIDFGDAIEDNNEGNPMGFFTYTFSTGSHIDSLEVAGTVINAEDHEPVKGILVGLHKLDSTWNDSIFRTKSLVRISRTNGSGKFSIKGVAEGKYRVFAVKDDDGDFRYSQKSEMLAFDTATIIPTCKVDIRQDTCWHDSIHYDSIHVTRYTHFYPDNIVLKAFLVNGQDQHLLKTQRDEPDWFRLYFTAPQKTLPKIKGLNFDESKLYLEASAKNDTLTYWMTDTAFTHHNDTLDIVLTYMETDSTGVLVERTDTLPSLLPKHTWASIKADRDKKIATWQKQYEKRQKRSKKPLPPENNPYLIETLEAKLDPSGSIDANQNPHIKVNEPIIGIDSTHIHLYAKKDSDLIPERFIIMPTENDKRSYTLYAEWKPGKTYSLLIDSLAITGIMGQKSQKIKTELKVKSLDEYGALFVNILPKYTTAIVQLLNNSDKVIMSHKVGKDGTAEFFFLKPGSYYMRCFLDENSNGIWDSGDYFKGKQAEEVFYFPKPMNVRAKWDVEQDWNIRSIDILQQKPQELTKQKADKEKTSLQRNAQRDAEKAQRKGGN